MHRESLSLGCMRLGSNEEGDKIHLYLFREFILERVLVSSLMFIQLK